MKNLFVIFAFLLSMNSFFWAGNGSSCMVSGLDEQTVVEPIIPGHLTLRKLVQARTKFPVLLVQLDNIFKLCHRNDNNINYDQIQDIGYFFDLTKKISEQGRPEMSGLHGTVSAIIGLHFQYFKRIGVEVLFQGLWEKLDSIEPGFLQHLHENY